MGVVNHEFEVTTPIPPATIFKALVLDADTLFPKVAPHAIKSVEVVQGDGGPGSIKKINFPEGGPFQYVKHKIEVVDKENFSYCYSVIEGGPLSDKLEKITYENKFVAAPGGGSICKSSSKYYTIGDHVITEEQIKAGIQRTEGVYKAVEAYVLANPNY